MEQKDAKAIDDCPKSHDEETDAKTALSAVEGGCECTGGRSTATAESEMQCRHCHFAQTGISAGFCCRLCARTPGKHGPFCEQRLVKCQANCGFAVTRHGATHCCLRCEHGEPHGPRCKRIACVEPAPDSDRFVGPRCIPSHFQLGDRVRITGGTRHVGETGTVVQVGASEASSGKRGASSAAALTILSDAAQAEVRVPAACVHGCAPVAGSSGGRPLGSPLGGEGRGGGSWGGDAAATGEHADADSLEPEAYQKPEPEPEPELEDGPPDPELERKLQANALRIEQQDALIGTMLERVALLEAQRQAQRQAEQLPGTGVG